MALHRTPACESDTTAAVTVPTALENDGWWAILREISGRIFSQTYSASGMYRPGSMIVAKKGEVNEGL
jgi:hypothetical protein